MKYYTIIIFAFFLLSCSSENFDYKISISDKEYTIMKEYMKMHKKITKNVLLQKDNISSNDKELLIKVKMRLAGIAGPISGRDCHGNIFPFVPIIINYQNNYYGINLSFLYSVNKLKEIDWLNDEDIYEIFYPKYIFSKETNVPEKLLNLTKEEFIKEYFLKDDNEQYKCKIENEIVLFAKDKDKENELLFESIIFLCIVKYNLLVTLLGNRIYFKEILLF
jgi:hypothetical protein